MKWLLTILAFYSMHLYAQTPEQNVKATINKMFEGMKNVDSGLLKDCFNDSVVFQTIQNKNGVVSVKNENIKDFISLLRNNLKGLPMNKLNLKQLKWMGHWPLYGRPINFITMVNSATAG